MNLKSLDVTINDIIDINVISASGKTVSSERVLNDGKIRFKAPLRAGVYIVNVIKNGEKVNSSKLIVN